MPKSLKPKDGKIDIFAVHTRLNVPEHKKVLHDDTRWITVIREPTSLYESLFSFFRLQNPYHFQFNQLHQRSMMVSYIIFIINCIT